MKKLLLLPLLALVLFTGKATQAQSPTPSSDIRQKVQEKVEEALKSPKAFMGSVTDVSDGTVQIKNVKGEIKQISVDGDLVTVVDSTGKTVKEVKLADIAIGDFIVAMGFKNPNEVLDAKRILIMPALGNPPRKSYVGTIDSFAKSKGILTTLKEAKKINFTTNTKTKFSLVVDSQIEDAKLTDITAGSKVIVSGVEDSTGLIVRRILVIQSNKSQ